MKYLIIYLWNKNKLSKNSDEKIDVVYTWADFTDENWLKRREDAREKYLGERKEIITPSSISMNELKYSIRSVEKYFKNLNNIYIITDNQIPDFIDLSNPRIKIIDHKAIFTNKNHLPSYNTLAIESYLHNIPRLTERFLYFNDDFFINDFFDFSDFFTKTGVVAQLGRKVSEKHCKIHNDPCSQAIKNTDLFLDVNFKFESRLTSMHRPQPLILNLLKKYEGEFNDLFEKTRQVHIRVFNKELIRYNVHNYLLNYVSFYEGLSLLKPNLFEKDMFYWKNDNVHNLKAFNKFKKQKMFCIQEDRTIELKDEFKIQFNELMDILYPEKSSFEK